MTSLLAFDSTTERTSAALRFRGRVWTREGEGGARASTTMLPMILALLDQAGARLADLDAIAFGRGPGAFTGIRTACSIAQGLACGAGKPVVAVDSLLAVAEEAREGVDAVRVWAVIDARMAQIYAAEYAFAGSRWRAVRPPFLSDAAALSERWREAPPDCVAGNALQVYGDLLDVQDARRVPAATPHARALLAVAERAFADGEAVDAADALPLYVRDKVAETTLERERSKAARDAREALPVNTAAAS